MPWDTTSEVELQRVASINKVHRTYDDRLKQDVEPLIQRVEELLSSKDIIPRDAIQFHLETYDAESQLFHGVLKVDSPIMVLDALIHIPMKRTDARILWSKRESLIPTIRVDLDRLSLTIVLQKFGLEDEDSGITAKVFVVPHPPVGRPPAGKSAVVSAKRVSADELASRDPHEYDDYDDEATGFIAEYNRLIEEAKGVFVDDAFVQSLRKIRYSENRWQAANAVVSAAEGLAAYLKSFAPSDGFKASAESLAGRDPREYDDYDKGTMGFIAEYNRLIEEAKGVFVDDAFVQSLREIRYSENRWQGANAVVSAAGGLAAYLRSFTPVDGFKASAESLAGRDPREYDDYDKETMGFIGEYNRLIEEAKGVFVDDAFVQSLREIRYSENRWQGANAVVSAAGGLAAYLRSFTPNDGFKASAESLAGRDPREYDDYDKETMGFIAEYNRLIQEAKDVFVDYPSVQSLQQLQYHGNRQQAAEAVVTAASGFVRIVANIKDVPIASELGVKEDGVEPLDYLPYSGRISPGARELAKELRREFSIAVPENENGYTDLHNAANIGLPGLVSALLDAGASPNARTTSGLTPLMSTVGSFARRGATRDSALMIAADLLGRGAAVNARTDQRWTALHFAAATNFKSVAELLIGQGADIDAFAAYWSEGGDWTPLDIAIRWEASEVAELLERHGAACNEKC